MAQFSNFLARITVMFNRKTSKKEKGKIKCFISDYILILQNIAHFTSNFKGLKHYFFIHFIFTLKSKWAGEGS